MNVIYKPIGDLVNNPRNARTHSDEQINQIAASEKRFGFLVPVLINSDGVILAGHGRVAAAKLLGFEEVPTIDVGDLTDAEERAFMIADNKIALNADWDMEILAEELHFLTRLDLDTEVEITDTGYSMPEIDLILAPVAENEPADPDVPDIDSEDVVSELGDIYQLGPHRIIVGDTREPDTSDALMAGEMADMVLTDPPYNVAIDGHVSGKGKHSHKEFAMASGEMDVSTFTAFLSASFSQLARVSCPGSLHYLFMDWRHLPELLDASHQVYQSTLNLCVWAKTNGGMGSLYRSAHELVLVAKKGSAPHINNVQLGSNGRNRTNVWQSPGANAFGRERDKMLEMHPTVKPVGLLADAILDVTHRGDTVLDGFLGSGSTLIACERTGRICYGIELDPMYVETAIERWELVTGGSAIHIETGLTLHERRNQRSLAATQEDASIIESTDEVDHV